MPRIRGYVILSPKQNIYIISPRFQDSGIIVKEGTERLQEPEVLDDYKETFCIQ